MMVLLVSCSNSQSNPSAEPEVSLSEVNEFDGEDGVLRIAMVQPSSTEPADLVLTDQAQVILSDLLHDGLTEVEANSGNLRPGLATSWSANEDFTAWTFQLDPNRLDAEQVKASFERQGNQRSAVVRELMSIISSIEVISEFELRFDLVRPAAGFAWLTSGPGMAVTTEGDDLSGRLQVVSEDTNGMVLASPEGLSDIDIRWTDSELEAQALLESDEVDIAVSGDGGSQGQALGHVRFVVINSASESLAGPTSRATINSILSSVDVPEITSANSTVDIDGLSSPALAGSSSLLCDQECNTGSGTPSQPVGELTLKLGVSSDLYLPLAEVIRNAFTDSNITIEVVQAEPEDLARRVSAGEIDMLLFGWVAGAASVDAVVPSLIRSDSPGNIFQLRDADIDRLLSEAALVGDDQRRWGLIAEAESLAISSDVVVPLGALSSKVRTNEDAASVAIRADGTLDTFRY